MPFAGFENFEACLLHMTTPKAEEIGRAHV